MSLTRLEGLQTIATKASINIRGGLLNAQSVGNKTLDIRELLHDKKFDLLAVSETWLSEYDNAKIREMTPSTHTFLHNPRKERRGGGVGIFLANSFKKIRLYKSEKKIRIT